MTRRVHMLGAALAGLDIHQPQGRIIESSQDERIGAGRDIVGAGNRGPRLDLIGRYINQPGYQAQEELGYDDDDDDDDDDISGADIIGAMRKAYVGATLSKRDRKAIRKGHHAAKKAERHAGGRKNDDLGEELRAARLPIIRTDEEGTLRALNFPLGNIVVPAGGTQDFVQVAQESIRVERLFLYAVGGSLDNIYVVNIFAGRQPQSVTPGQDEPAIFYSFNAVGASIQGFTVNFGLTLRVTMRNLTGAPVTVGGKMIGRSLT